MSVPAAYLAVIAIWSTTPISIKWSSEGLSFISGVTMRMLIGAVICVALVTLFRVALPWHRQALQAYVAGSLAVFAGMLSVYWGAQYINSGLVALIFGLSPLATTLIAVVMGTEVRPGPVKLLGVVTAIGGLLCIVSLGGNSLSSGGENVLLGMLAVFISMIFHSVSTVWVKQVNNGLSALTMTTGSLLVSVPMYLLVWWLIDGAIPQDMPIRAVSSIIYLGIFGSVLGYMFYFYTLRHVSASNVALITLVTPVTALLIGQAFNGEQVTATVWFGTALIILGLTLNQWESRFRLKPV